MAAARIVNVARPALNTAGLAALPFLLSLFLLSGE